MIALRNDITFILDYSRIWQFSVQKDYLATWGILSTINTIHGLTGNGTAESSAGRESLNLFLLCGRKCFLYCDDHHSLSGSLAVHFRILRCDVGPEWIFSEAEEVCKQWTRKTGDFYYLSNRVFLKGDAQGNWRLEPWEMSFWVIWINKSLVHCL